MNVDWLYLKGKITKFKNINRFAVSDLKEEHMYNYWKYCVRWVYFGINKKHFLNLTAKIIFIR